MELKRVLYTTKNKKKIKKLRYINSIKTIGFPLHDIYDTCMNMRIWLFVSFNAVNNTNVS